MPKRWTKPTVDEQQRFDEGDNSHYFESAHGDVAALHSRIEQGYIGYPTVPVLTAANAHPVDKLVENVSRMAGIVGLTMALLGIGYWLI